MLSDSIKQILAEQLKRHEGRVLDERGRHKPYLDSEGVLTVGYGHNLMARPVPGNSTLNEEQASRLLMADMANAEFDLFAAFPSVQTLDEVRQATLVNMVFNLGINKFLQFRRMLAALEKQDYFTAADEMLNSKWARQVGYRADQLARQMRYGEWVLR